MKNFHYQTAERLARLLDNEFKIFGIRIGLDPILGLVPGFGDVFSLAFGAYIIYVAKIVGVPNNKIARMTANLVFDAMIGLIPVAGDMADVFFRSNKRNWEIVKQHKLGGIVEEGEVVG